MTERKAVWPLLALSVMAALLFFALGIWQVQRRTWKLALLASVAERVHAPPSSLPSPSGWTRMTTGDDAYRHVKVHGRFLTGRATLVQASTEQGSGFWLLAPLRSDQDYIILVNRGFVPPGWPSEGALAPSVPSGETTITGLLRVTEPGGSLLRANQPAHDRWFSRDIQAIARARGLGKTAPFFIDADASTGPPRWPQGGLTVVNFPNNHLAYALTWFGLSALSAIGAMVVLRDAIVGRNAVAAQ